MADPSGSEAESTTESAKASGAAEVHAPEADRDSPAEGAAAPTEAFEASTAPKSGLKGADETTEAFEASTAPKSGLKGADETTETWDVTEITAEPTVVMAPQPPPRRFTAPSGFDAGATAKIERPPEPATEILPGSPSAQTQPVGAPPAPPKSAGPQSIPARRPSRRRRSWGWVLALILVIAALVAVAILGTVWLTRDNTPRVSQEDRVRTAIQNFDSAMQKGDLAALRSITCGTTRDAYVSYDERAWTETHDRIAAAKQYPVVASIDQVVVNDAHAEANVTTFMAYAPQVRSTRSFDLQYRDDQWKICEAPNP